MKLLMLYGNAELEKRRELAEKIMEKNPTVLVQFPEICLPNKESFEKEENQLMKVCSLNCIFLESHATSYELAMLKNSNSPYKIIYNDFKLKKNQNLLVKNSGFIQNFIDNDDYPNEKILKIKIEKIVLTKKNNLLADFHLKYDINQVCELLLKIDPELKCVNYNEEIFLNFSILKIRLKYIEILFIISKIILKHYPDRIVRFNKVKEKTFETMIFKPQKPPKKEITEFIWNACKLNVIKAFLGIDDTSGENFNNLLEKKNYREKKKIKAEFNTLNEMISEYLGEK